MKTRPLVLHFTAALGGGLEAVIHDYVRNAPEYRHELLYARRGEFAIGAAAESTVSSHPASAKPAELRRALQTAIDELEPDILHIHSVTAGVVGRITAPDSVAVAYTPHSYFHERNNLPMAVRLAARGLERMLRSRTDLVIAVSPAEAATAVAMGIPSVFVPNVAEFDLRSTSVDTTSRPGELDVVGSGRLSAQKDPMFFAAVKREVDLSMPGLRWGWLGGGENRLRKALETAGITVSGWLPRQQVLGSLASSRCYVHTAAWEGNPVSLLEVASLGVTSVARSIPALVSLGHRADLVTPQQVATAVLEQFAAAADGSDHPRVPMRSGFSVAPAAQQAALEMAYRRVRDLRDARVAELLPNARRRQSAALPIKRLG